MMGVKDCGKKKMQPELFWYMWSFIWFPRIKRHSPFLFHTGPLALSVCLHDKIPLMSRDFFKIHSTKTACLLA